ncbi:MAG: AAA family ATPase, partial [Gammaproteobacteria bacterium]|nr:AAA family ATPase [Gammaproteobacteria bacterium]
MSTTLDIAALTQEKQIIVCCGSGGVGKTTSAAALGVLAAKQGRRALVMTIDPAHRLAQAMGLDGLSNDPQ